MLLSFYHDSLQTIWRISSLNFYRYYRCNTGALTTMVWGSQLCLAASPASSRPRTNAVHAYNVQQPNRNDNTILRFEQAVYMRVCVFFPSCLRTINIVVGDTAATDLSAAVTNVYPNKHTRAPQKNIIHTILYCTYIMVRIIGITRDE